jgi:CHAT domain-containing protein
VTRYLLAIAICILFSFGWLHYSGSQTPVASTFEALAQYKAAEEFYQQATQLNSSPDYTEEKERELNAKALSAFKKASSHRSLPDSLKFFSTFKIGELEHYFENLQEALRSYLEAMRIQPESRLPDSVLFKPLLYSGLIYYNQSNLDSAIYSFKEAEKIQERYGNKLSEKERLYNVFGVLYYETGNYLQARNYIEKALEVLPRDHPYYKDLYINYQINLGQISLKLEDYDRANRIYQQILPLNINTQEILHNIGLINLYLGSAKKALGYFRQVKFNSQKDIRLYTNTGNAFLNLEETDSALYYFQKALAVPVPLNNTTSISVGNTYKSLGDLYLAKQQNFEAARYYQKSITHFYPSFNDTSIKANPQTFSGIFSYINLFHAITGKADAFNALYRATTNISWAIEELNAYRSAFELVDYVEKVYDSDEARLFLNKIKYVVHNKPIKAAFELHLLTHDKKYLGNLYYFDQKNKASVLSFHQQRNSTATVNPRILSLKRDITRLSIKAATITDSTEFANINKDIRDKEIELGRLQEQAGREIQWNERLPDIADIQKKILDKNTALVSYHIADSLLYILLITDDEFRVERKKMPDKFGNDLFSLVTSLHVPEAAGSNTSKWFSTLIPALNEDISRLIIIPDDELNYFPFESLVDKEGKYLLSKYAVQYQYATALLKKDKFDYNSLRQTSFAPFSNFSNDSFDQLDVSEEEIRDLPGKKYIGANATKAQFIQDVSHTGIFHLATHASANDSTEKTAYIAFYPSTADYLLFAREIYSLDLKKTRLVILSACETGSGELEKGEGVMSLSRAFAYAGCPNVITSLWKADDASTSYIMKRLHYHLAKGAPIDKALAEAKRDYLADDKINPRRKVPAYWANLVFIGNYEPEPNYLPLILLMSAVVIVIALVFLTKKTSA